MKFNVLDFIVNLNGAEEMTDSLFMEYTRIRVKTKKGRYYFVSMRDRTYKLALEGGYVLEHQSGVKGKIFLSEKGTILAKFATL